MSTPSPCSVKWCPPWRERTRAQERWFDVAIGRGEPAEVIVDLESAVDAHPTHERFWAQLILARSQAGRPAEALQTYQTARKVLAAELGIDPGPEIQQAYERISKGAAVPSASARAREAQTVSDLPKPAELPADNGAFTGRATELGRLRTRLTSSRPRPVVAITGLGGVGKSALAIHVAHQIADDFPDGQLYVDLYGSTPGRDPLQPLEVLGRFLRSFGLANPAIPASVDEAAARFRSVTGRRRVLVVLDNARDVHQIRPLIPGGPGCGVVVTCRRSLASLVNVEQCHLDVLSQEEAGLLLSRLVGRERVETEREAAAAVVRLCGGLPVKLCVAAARLTARPEETFDALRDRLAMEQGRLPATATA
ncbi:BTAD domain-containing putative transcriptional regulator [Thermocatellispora tengchongensis]|uniref:BTAD domain-containing putative transcriptional regulator n=1 Tax=Thermocatellispora tengchongensis TaxID=1073253 RepID=UPI00362DBA99